MTDIVDGLGEATSIEWGATEMKNAALSENPTNDEIVRAVIEGAGGNYVPFVAGGNALREVDSPEQRNIVFGMHVGIDIWGVLRAGVDYHELLAEAGGDHAKVEAYAVGRLLTGLRQIRQQMDTPLGKGIADFRTAQRDEREAKHAADAAADAEPPVPEVEVNTLVGKKVTKVGVADEIDEDVPDGFGLATATLADGTRAKTYGPQKPEGA